MLIYALIRDSFLLQKVLFLPRLLPWIWIFFKIIFSSSTLLYQEEWEQAGHKNNEAFHGDFYFTVTKMEHLFWSATIKWNHIAESSCLFKDGPHWPIKWICDILY